MKKILFMLLAALILVSMVSCGKDKASKDTESTISEIEASLESISDETIEESNEIESLDAASEASEVAGSVESEEVASTEAASEIVSEN